VTRERDERRAWRGFGAAVAAVVAANLVLHGARLRGDFSRGRIYSVSAASLRTLRALRGPVTAEVYASPDLPPQAAASRDYLLDILDELRVGAAGKLNVIRIPVDSPEAAERADRAGVAAVRFDVVERDKFETREGRLGVRLFYGKAQRAIPFVADPASLEYDIVGRVRQMTDDSRPALGFARDAGAAGADRLPPPVRQRLFERFDVRTVDLSSAAEAGFAPDLKVLAVVGPSAAFSARSLYALDRFLVGGGSVLLAADAKAVDLQAFRAYARDVGLSSWTASKGVSIRDALVYDAQNQAIQISVPEGRALAAHLVHYPPFVVASDFPAHPATRGLGSLVLPFVSPVETAPRAGLKETPLMRSTAYSWLAAEGRPVANVSPFEIAPPAPAAARGPFALAAAVEGAFEPLFKAPPKGVRRGLPALVPAPGRLLVVGSSHFIDQGLGVPEGDYVFLLNAADWLAADDDLISIRTKSVAFTPLAEIPASARAAVRWTLVLLPPLLAVAAGFAAWRLRQRRRRRLEALYGAAA